MLLYIVLHSFYHSLVNKDEHKSDIPLEFIYLDRFQRNYTNKQFRCD